MQMGIYVEMFEDEASEDNMGLKVKDKGSEIATAFALSCFTVDGCSSYCLVIVIRFMLNTDRKDPLTFERGSWNCQQLLRQFCQQRQDLLMILPPFKNVDIFWRKTKRFIFYNFSLSIYFFQTFKLLRVQKFKLFNF